MELKSVIAALILLAILFGWYAWLEARERRRGRIVNRRSPVNGESDGHGAGANGELWKGE